MLAGVRGRLLVSSVCAMCAYTNLRSYIHSSDVDIKKPQDERNDRPYSISQAMCKKRNEGKENSAPLWPPHLSVCPSLHVVVSKEIHAIGNVSEAGMSQKMMGKEVMVGRDGLLARIPGRDESQFQSSMNARLPGAVDHGEEGYKKSSARARFLPRISSEETLGTGPSAFSFARGK